MPNSDARPAAYWGALLRSHGLRPKKRLGQNFLVDPIALERVLGAAQLTGKETVLEIGSGLGSLTRLLVRHAGRVAAIEIDRRLESAFSEAVGRPSNLTMMWGDVRHSKWGVAIAGDSYAVVANIPYSLTSLLLRELLESQRKPFRVVLTLQQEVVERILKGPGDMSLLALSVQLYGEPRSAGNIPASSFLPSPDVDSTILRVDVHATPLVRAEMIPVLFRAARAGFGQRRKQLRNALAGGMRVPPSLAAQWLERSGISSSARAQELSMEDWERLASVLMAGASDTTRAGRGGGRSDPGPEAAV